MMMACYLSMNGMGVQQGSCKQQAAYWELKLDHEPLGQARDMVGQARDRWAEVFDLLTAWGGSGSSWGSHGHGSPEGT